MFEKQAEILVNHGLEVVFIYIGYYIYLGKKGLNGTNYLQT